MTVARGVQPSVAAVSVIKPGMLTTIQDVGRWGFQSRGVPVAGPMDPVSHRLANAPVGNGRDAAYLAVSGGITVAPTLGSRSTHLVSAMGGVGGRALMAGDRLPLGDPSRPQGRALAPQTAV